MKEGFFIISKVAQFFSISTASIRYYENYGLLKPAYIDEQTNYRYYNTSNINTISYILDLKNSGMSMKQIKSYLVGELSRKNFLNNLIKKKTLLDALIEHNKKISLNNNQFEVEEIVIDNYYRYTKNYFAKNLEEVFKCYYSFLNEVVTNCVPVTSFSGFIEYDSNYAKFENLNLIIGFEVSQNSKNAVKSNYSKGLSIYYKGNYENINLAYDKLHDYAKKHNLTLQNKAIEYYLESFNQNNAKSEYLTKIIIPLC